MAAVFATAAVDLPDPEQPFDITPGSEFRVSSFRFATNPSIKIHGYAGRFRHGIAMAAAPLCFGGGMELHVPQKEYEQPFPNTGVLFCEGKIQQKAPVKVLFILNGCSFRIPSVHEN